LLSAALISHCFEAGMLLWPKKRSYARHCLLPHSTRVTGAIPAPTTQMQTDIIYTPRTLGRKRCDIWGPSLAILSGYER